MGETYSTHGENEKCIQNLAEDLKGKNCFESLDGKVILKWIVKT